MDNKFIPKSKITSHLGWVDPDGRFWEVQIGQHQTFAKWFFNTDDHLAGDRLLNLRWAKLADEEIIMPRHPSSALKATIYNWMNEFPNGRKSFPEGDLTAKEFFEKYSQTLSKRIP